MYVCVYVHVCVCVCVSGVECIWIDGLVGMDE